MTLGMTALETRPTIAITNPAPLLRWTAVTLISITIVLAVAYFGYQLFPVRRDSVGIAVVLRGILDGPGSVFAVLTTLCGGFIAGAYRAATINAATQALGTTVGFAAIWVAGVLSAVLPFCIGRLLLAQAINQKPGEIQRINAFMRRWAVPIVALTGLIPPPFPIAFICFALGTSGMRYGRFVGSYAISYAVGAGITTLWGEKILPDPDFSWPELIALLLAPLVIVPLVRLAKRILKPKAANIHQRSE